MIRGNSLAILALLALVVLATGSVSAAPRQQAVDDATLSSLSLSGVDINAYFRLPPAPFYTATVAHTVTETTVTATPTNSRRHRGHLDAQCAWWTRTAQCP